ncbi:MAG TPA: hypothetical protein VK447_11640, partial [Myxococcaceae bacterium]|nr:hypothetical protein [Myxococcaceae bacterium]
MERTGLRSWRSGALLGGVLLVACAPRATVVPLRAPVVPAPTVTEAPRPPPAPVPAPDKSDSGTEPPRIPFAQVREEQGRAWRAEWNHAIADALDRFGQPLLDDSKVPGAEVSALCPGYFRASREEKKAFWALLFAAIARLESGFDPERSFWEPKPLRVLSVGLLQLSYGDEQRHPDCPLDATAANITQPEVNLRCGVA